jgi:hypothetical protein
LLYFPCIVVGRCVSRCKRRFPICV